MVPRKGADLAKRGISAHLGPVPPEELGMGFSMELKAGGEEVPSVLGLFVSLMLGSDQLDPHRRTAEMEGAGVVGASREGGPSQTSLCSPLQMVHTLTL